MALAALLAVASRGVCVSASETSFATNVAPHLRTYCVDCHSDDLAEAGVNLQQLAETQSIGVAFKTWEKVIEMLRQGKMPPETMPQPTDQERSTIIDGLQGELARFIEQNAGDPGTVVMRRLTSAEYAYAIQDLTGLDLPLEKLFVSDAVGGEGFTNVGQVQFIEDATLERYLEAAKTVAAHAIVGSGPLGFFEDPGATGLELSAINRIQAIYRAHGFRTGAGEGAEPFGLDRYPKAFYVAWQYRHRDALGLSALSLAELAEAEGISERFAAYIWKVFNRSAESFPTSAICAAWQSLPAPGHDQDPDLEARVRTGCDDIYSTMRDWQALLAANAADEEEAPVLDGESLDFDSSQQFKADIDWPPGAKTAAIEIVLRQAAPGSAGASTLIFRNPCLRFRTTDREWTTEVPLADVLTTESSQQLSWGTDPAGGQLGEHDFALQSPRTLSLQFKIPDTMVGAELLTLVELDRRSGRASPVRCTISDGLVEGETVAESGGYSVLLADPESKSYAAWERGALEFARLLPEVSQREPAPSDRDPIPPPFDNTYNNAERNFYHYRVKYHRDDGFLVQNMLDDRVREQLDHAWNDLQLSFEYHDTFLRFVAGKFDIELADRSISHLDPAWIEQLPPEPRAHVLRLQQHYQEAQDCWRAAETRHVDDALEFAALAWRRPVTEREQSALREFYRSLRQDTSIDHTQAMRGLLTRILVAPAFLYRAEPPTADHGIVPLADWELASRLSFFLWSSVPDAQLRQAARAGRLSDPDELARQARRMLRDAKSRRFATEFFGQWFGFYRFDDYRGVDSGRFPEFSSTLKQTMYDEAISFFEHIVRQDRPTEEILFADYAFLNRDLVEHYGLALNAEAEERLARVEATNLQYRGGVLGLGAVLTVTSAPLRTSPVKRGDWILRRILGTPVPPPPPDAGSIPADDILADGQTVRERLEAHRSDSACVNCHARMDPLGFALEHFDSIGRWRDTYRDGQPIDSSGTLHDGTAIAGPDGLRRYLRENELLFRRTLSAKLLGYALGRSEIASDRPLIEQMMADLDDDDRFSRLIVRIVRSPQFRQQRAGAALQTRTGATPPETGAVHENR